MCNLSEVVLAALGSKTPNFTWKPKLIFRFWGHKIRAMNKQRLGHELRKLGDELRKVAKNALRYIYNIIYILNIIFFLKFPACERSEHPVPP